MVNICHSGRWDVAARGHAGCGPVGQDIVCAAVSVVMDLYAEHVNNMAKAQARVVRGPGRLQVQVTSKRGLSAKQRQSLDAVCAAVLTTLHRLALTYPDAVQVFSTPGPQENR